MQRNTSLAINPTVFRGLILPVYILFNIFKHSANQHVLAECKMSKSFFFFFTVTCINFNFSVCRPSTPPRSFPTRRASCCCGRQPKSSAGPSTTAPSLWCGEEAASSEGTLNLSSHMSPHIASLPPCHLVQLYVNRHLSHWRWRLWLGSVKNFLRKQEE